MTLGELVDLMLPGDDLFPAASAVGVHGLLRRRLQEIGGEAALSILTNASGQGGINALADLEHEKPELFTKLRSVVFLTYYEMPEVQEAIRSLGHRYNAEPLPKGYAMGRFDPTRDAPAHGRGHYVKTEDVKRLDLSGLDFLGERHG
ncbi:MAG: hypothetical protein OEU92_20760 [Alphaproteobacteria bacterium]|nr:hypothetical protein [Alphaproteobacteria bacterium]